MDRYSMNEVVQEWIKKAMRSHLLELLAEING